MFECSWCLGRLSGGTRDGPAMCSRSPRAAGDATWRNMSLVAVPSPPDIGTFESPFRARVGSNLRAHSARDTTGGWKGGLGSASF